MAITRTAMVDDDGSGTTGTILNNAWKQELYNQIDAKIPTTTYLEVSIPGGVYNDWNPGINGDTNIAIQQAAAINISGFKPATPPYNGQTIRIACFAQHAINFKHEDAASTMGYRLRCPEALITVSAYWGYAVFNYFSFVGGGFWMMVGHENGHGVSG
jgi:hypothetical protein